MNIFGTSFNYAARLNKVKAMMEERDIDCLFVHRWANQYYIAGVVQHLPWYPDVNSQSGEAPVILFKEGPPVYVCAYLCVNSVKEQSWIEDVRAYDRDSSIKAFSYRSDVSVYEYVGEILRERGLEAGSIGIEEDCCSVSTFRAFQACLPKARFKNVREIFDIARAVKEPEEIQLIRKSVAIAEAGMKVGMDMAKPGVSEMEVQRAIEIEMRRLGGFREVEAICQSGVRTANYRAFAAEWKKIEPNDIVLLDYGCVYKGYGCDLSRSWVVGTPTNEQKKIAADLYKLYDRVLAFIKPGLKYQDVQDFARDEWGSLGYLASKQAYPHPIFSLHGIGLGPLHDTPDRPYPDMILESGMTFSVQPAVRHEKFTIRFEDDMLLTPHGVELMSTLPRELI